MVPNFNQPAWLSEKFKLTNFISVWILGIYCICWYWIDTIYTQYTILYLIYKNLLCRIPSSFSLTILLIVWCYVIIWSQWSVNSAPTITERIMMTDWLTQLKNDTLSGVPRGTIKIRSLPKSRIRASEKNVVGYILIFTKNWISEMGVLISIYGLSITTIALVCLISSLVLSICVFESPTYHYQ